MWEIVGAKPFGTIRIVNMYATQTFGVFRVVTSGSEFGFCPRLSATADDHG